MILIPVSFGLGLARCCGYRERSTLVVSARQAARLTQSRVAAEMSTQLVAVGQNWHRSFTASEGMMNRTRVLIWGVLAAVGLQGCSTEPSLVSGNKRGGIILHATTSNKSATFTLADSHCRQYGEIAQVTVVDLIGNRVKFLCTAR